jgi:predicted nucleotidyltransferase
VRDRPRLDSAALDARLSDRQAEAIRRIVETTDDGGQLEFLVVYGSVSRGEQSPGSDLDVYYETSDLAVDLEQADPESRWHVFGASSGALLANLRLGDGFAFELLADALVVYDDGHFRDLLVAVSEEKLKPAEPPDV